MRWAQFAILFMIFASLLACAHDHGKPRKGVESFWHVLVAQLVLLFLIYLAGGFSKVLQ